MSVIRFLILISVLFGFPGTAQSESPDTPEKSFKPLPVIVSIMPQAYFVERIGGRRVLVEVLVLPGENPATYKPSPIQMLSIVKSDIFFRIGVPFEETLLPKIKTIAKNLQIVDTREGIKLRRLEVRLDHQDDHAKMDSGRADQDEGEHTHTHGLEGNDPHIWLSPRLVKKQAETIRRTLVRVDPEGEEEYTANFKGFIRDIEILESKIAATLAPFQGQSIYVFHPSFGYFADEYGLNQVAVEIEGKSPKGKDLAQFIKRAKREKARIVFVQPQFDQSAAGKIAQAINGTVISIDPLAGDYLNNLEEMSNRISRALER
ncbi:MAG: zinc ABC transporter substrate-binding protein [Desulfobacterales bacterium]